MAALQPGVPESTINFVSINGGMRESTLKFESAEDTKVAPQITTQNQAKIIKSMPVIRSESPCGEMDLSETGLANARRVKSVVNPIITITEAEVHL